MSRESWVVGWGLGVPSMRSGQATGRGSRVEGSFAALSTSYGSRGAGSFAALRTSYGSRVEYTGAHPFVIPAKPRFSPG
jgi:hypothetical protein